MSKVVICALAVLALASPAVAAAGENIQVTIGKEAPAAIPGYVLAPQEFSSYARPYLLETGMVLTFEQRARRYYTSMPNESRVEIYPLAQGVFTSANGTLFVFRDEGDSIAVSHMQRLPFAGLGRIDPARVYTAMR